MKTEINVEMNVHEIGILLSALQNLGHSDEIHIAREYGSTSALYNKLYSLRHTTDEHFSS
tara:strand:- start:337 stop:516 length:180 start_codon:yes stop_codon:yes gene_type:complete